MNEKCCICNAKLNAYERRYGYLCAKHMQEAADYESAAVARELQERSRGGNFPD